MDDPSEEHLDVHRSVLEIGDRDRATGMTHPKDRSKGCSKGRSEGRSSISLLLISLVHKAIRQGD